MPPPIDDDDDSAAKERGVAGVAAVAAKGEEEERRRRVRGGLGRRTGRTVNTIVMTRADGYISTTTTTITPLPLPLPKQAMMVNDDDDPLPAIDAVSFVDTGACMLLLGAPSVGKSTLLWRLHHAHRPLAASMRLAALLDAVSAKTCRETLLAFCRGPAPRGPGGDNNAGAPARAAAYDRQLIVDDVDALPKQVQCILAALMDRFRPTHDQPSPSGRCRFVFSCAAMAKVHTALQTRLPCVRLVPPSSAALATLAREEADRRGLRFAPALWQSFCAQYCGPPHVNPRAAKAALHRLSLLAAAAAADEVCADWLHDVRLDAFDALLRDASRGAVVAAYRELREVHGLAPADLLDALFLHVRDRGGAAAAELSPSRQFQWFELIGRAMRGLPPYLGATGDEATNEVPWFCVMIAAEKSLL